MPPINTSALLRDRLSKRLSLRTILIVPFVLQILGIVGLVGSLFFLKLIVVVMPESDFISQMDANTRNTILFCIAALVIATAIGILTTRWVIKPLVELNCAVEIAQAELDRTLKMQRSDEVGELARSFNGMAAQLRNLSETLESKNAELQHFNQLKAEFWVDASYQLRIPLNRMIAIAESMRDGATGKLSKVQERHLWMMAQSGHQLAHLIDNIADVSQPSSEDEPLARIHTHLPLSPLQAAMQIEESKYRIMFEHAIEGIFQSSPAGKFLNVNPALAKLFGYDSPAEMLTVVQEIAEQIYVDRQKRGEFEQRLAAQGEVRDFEVEVYRRDRSKIWVSIWARVVKDAQGHVLYYEGNCVDITQRKREEAGLKQQLQELQFEIDHSQRERQVAAILGTDYFQQLLAEADELRYSDN